MNTEITSEQVAEAISVSWRVAERLGDIEAWSGLADRIDGMQSLHIVASVGHESFPAVHDDVHFLWRIAIDRMVH